MIDLVLLAPDGACVLVIVEERPWDGSPRRVHELQDKMNGHLNYVIFGRLARRGAPADQGAARPAGDIDHPPR